MPIIFPVKSLTRLYHVGIPEVCAPSNDIFFLTKSYRPSTIFYMDLRETTSPTQGALRLPSLALPGSHSPRGGVHQSTSIWQAASRAQEKQDDSQASWTCLRKRDTGDASRYLSNFDGSSVLFLQTKKTLTNPSIRTNPNTARLRSLPVKLPTSTIRSEGEFAFSRACKKQKSK